MAPRQRSRRTFIGLSLAILSLRCTAAEWSVQPVAELYLDHDSNRLLTPVSAAVQSNEAMWLTLDADLKRATETGELNLHPQFQRQQFTGDAALDSSNGSIQLLGAHRGEMLSYAGNISYADRSTLLSEISETGIIDAHARQQALNTGFSISDQMTERQRLGADAGFSNVKYPDGEQLGLVAYRHTSASIDYAFSVSEATTLSAVVFGAQETAPDLGFTSDDAGARIGLAWNLAPDSALSASAGASRASFASEVIYGSVWALQASHHSERTQWELTLTRDVVPTGVGYLTRRDQLDLSAVRKMTEHVDLTIRLLAAANHDVQSRVVQTDRRYFTGTAGLAWHLTEKWLMSFELRASGARYPDEPGTLDDANGWQSAVRLRWTPPIYTVSR